LEGKKGSCFSLKWSGTSHPLGHGPACEGFGCLLIPAPPQAEILGGCPLKMGIREEMDAEGRVIGVGENLCGSPDHEFVSLSFAPCGFGSQGVGLKLRTSGFKPWCCPKISEGHQESPLMQPGRERFLLKVSALTSPGSCVLEHPIAYFGHCFA